MKRNLKNILVKKQNENRTKVYTKFVVNCSIAILKKCNYLPFILLPSFLDCRSMVCRSVLDHFSIAARSFLDHRSLYRTCSLVVGSMYRRSGCTQTLLNKLTNIPYGFLKPIPQYMPRAPD